ncbi:fasciclin domain-containing protein [Mesohalobacter halotolerans]|uniref:Fasciclin domain-containing protein n=1 Tax=Mesohalobacter halotolerans TaxID=1883405 RepID=A0A4U5TNQ9_9FLAO|nr:fasciclin domain-containing protein [Mesohalobacter halotolerans]MBS3738124.1 fasciclin domain-containing protein [Psychroflexus sp.]TKS55657.1 fasciclin domain-containing protein [Mesohalobacter halotolerans]
MKKMIKSTSLIAMLIFATSVNAQKSSYDIVKNAASIDDFSTLVTAVKAAELVDVLQSKGPFTVFAPTNDAFGKLPKETLSNLLKPENKTTLQKVLTYHVVKGNLMASDVLTAVKKNGGKLKVETVSGDSFTVTTKNDSAVIMDAKGNTSTIIKTDVKSSNGVIHVIDTVILP